ncbi:putative nucleotidyltransferase, ribonuclease H [Tanacetum coccineum]
MRSSAIASPLTDLLKKNKAWIWDEECQASFESLKKAVMEEPVLRLPDVTMPFELHTDASYFAIGGVLMQDGHPISFESRKLNETERKYTVQEKEMTAIVHCLRIWRHYLFGSRFVIKTDNIGTSYFQTQKKLSPKQARWQDFLAEFDYQLEYKTGKANAVAKALSHKAEFAELFKIIETDLNFSTSFHPQMNRQIERSEATGKSPFELVTGRQPLTPNSLAASYEGTAKKMKKWANQRRRHVEFEVGDQGMVKLLPQQFKSLRKVHRGFIWRYECPFLAIGHVGKVSYRVQLPPKLKIYLVFYVSFPKPYHGAKEDPKRGVSKWAPTSVVTSYDREVKKILSDCTIQRQGVLSYKEYLIKWRDLPDSEGKRKTYCGSLLTRSRDITRMARRGHRELRWGRMSRLARFYEVTRDSGLFYT